MKTIFTLRFLCVIAFLLLFCPFYDNCNGKGMKEKASEVTEAASALEANTNPVIASVEKPLQKVEKPFLNTIYEFIDDNASQSAIEFAWISIDIAEISFQEFKADVKKSITKNDFAVLFFWLKNFSFLVISILTFLNLVLCFTSKIEFVYRFSRWNIVLLLLTIICIFLEDFLEQLSQIKWGYYCFFINSIMIFYISKKLFKIDLNSPN